VNKYATSETAAFDALRADYESHDLIRLAPHHRLAVVVKRELDRLWADRIDLINSGYRRDYADARYNDSMHCLHLAWHSLAQFLDSPPIGGERLT
jgi:hypothetical protein